MAAILKEDPTPNRVRRSSRGASPRYCGASGVGFGGGARRRKLAKTMALHGTRKGGGGNLCATCAKCAMLSTGPPMAHFTCCGAEVVPQFFVARAATNARSPRQVGLPCGASTLDSLVAIRRHPETAHGASVRQGGAVLALQHGDDLRQGGKVENAGTLWRTKRGGAGKVAKCAMLSTWPPMAHFTRCGAEVVPQFFVARAATNARSPRQVGLPCGASTLDSLVAIRR
jgi:hypothetical protein